MTYEGNASAERTTMVDKLFAVIDAGDIDGLVDLFEVDGVQELGNRPPLRGHDEIRAGNSSFLTSLAKIKHETTGLWESDGTVIVRLLVHYELRDGRRMTLPSATMFSEGPTGLISHYQVWFDGSPLAAPA